MDEKESKSPWDQLAQDLGAEPSSDAFERSQPPAVEIPTAEDSSEGEEVPESPPQSPSDWGALADSLGLEVSVPASPAAEPPKDLAEPTEENLPQETSEVSEPVKDLASQGDEGGFGVGVGDSFGDDGGDDFGSDIGGSDIEGSDIDEEESEQASADSLPPLPDEVDQIMSEGGWEAEQDTSESSETTSDEADADDQTADDSGITGEAARNAFDALFTAGGSAVALPNSDPPTERRSFDFEEAEGSLDPVKKSEDSEDDEPERPKRKRSRRRRRGRGGRKNEAEQSTGDEKKPAEDSLGEGTQEDRSEEDSSQDEEKPRRRRSRRRSRPASSADSNNRTDPDESELTDEEILSGSRGGSSRDRTGHRNMPTWEQALSVIVDANVENHSKAPSKPSSPRGRGRGGRRKRKS